MKTHSLLLAAFTFTLSTGLAAGGNSAREAIRTVAREKGSDVMTRIVNVSGSRGQDQPHVWRIVTQRPGGPGFLEYFVQGGRIVNSGPVSASNAASISGHAIPQKKLKYDSTAAFAVAEKAARTAKSGFDSADYDLRCLELSDRPVWFITLWNGTGGRSGEVTVAADTGQILRKAFFAPGAVVTAGRGPARGAGPALQNAVYQPAPQSGIWDKTKSGVTRGAVVVKDSVVNASGKVRGFFNRVMGRPEQPEYLYSQPQTTPVQPQPAPQPMNGQTYYYQPNR